MSAELVSAFLDDIVANIDDDTPRLVYADWLTEHGHDDRAELIRVQVEMSRLPSWDARRVRLGLREKALLDANGERWLAEMPKIDGVVWEGFRRGIVAEVSFKDFEAFRRLANEVRKLAPVEAVKTRWPLREEFTAEGDDVAELRELTMVGAPNYWDVEWLADSPQLSTLRVLTAGGLWSQAFGRLVASPHLGNLRSLRMPSSALGNDGIGELVLANGSRLALEKLDLSGTGTPERYEVDPGINAEGIRALVRWPGFASLRTLTLSGNDVQADGLRALLRSRSAGLTVLRVRNALLTGEAIEAFDGESAHRLDVLDLGGNLIGDTGVAHLASSPCLARLKQLHLDRCELKAGGARHLAAAPFVAGLRHLDLGHNRLGLVGLSALLAGAPSQLHTLRINDNDLFDKGAVALAASPAADRLVCLDIGENVLTTSGVSALAASPHLSNLAALRLSGNALGNATPADL